MRSYARWAALVVAGALFRTAHADSGTIFFANRTSDPYSITFVSANGCVTNPDKSGFTVDRFTTHVYEITTSSSCGDAQIQWKISQNVARLHYVVSANITYQRYKGTNGKWLAKVSVDPRPPRLVFKVTCGTTYTACQQIGVPSSNTHAVITVLSVGEIVTDVMTF